MITTQRIGRMQRVVGIAIVVALMAPAAGLAADDVPGRLATLERRLAVYRIDGDIRTHLLLRYFDEPYTRAAIVCVMGTQAHLTGCVAGWASHEPSELDRNRVAAALSWCEQTMAAVERGEKALRFAADRLSLLPGQGRAGTQPPVISVGFVLNGQAQGPYDELAQAVDCMACLGAKLCVDARAGLDDAVRKRLAARAAHRGMVYCGSPAGPTEALAGFVEPVTIRALLAAPAPTDAGLIWPGVVPGLQSRHSLAWASRLVHDVAGERLTAMGRLVLPLTENDPIETARWRAWLWRHVLAGCDLPIVTLDGPRGPIDGGNVWLRPWLVAATAECGLDFQRLSDATRRFRQPSSIAMLVAPHAAELAAEAASIADDSPCTIDPWPLARIDEVRRRDYDVVLVVATADEVSDVRQAAGFDGIRDRVTLLTDQPVAFDDVNTTTPSQLAALATGFRVCHALPDAVSVGTNDKGRHHVWYHVVPDGSDQLLAVINASIVPLPIRIQRGARTVSGPVQELISGQAVTLAADGLTLEPYGVRLFRIPHDGS